MNDPVKLAATAKPARLGPQKRLQKRPQEVAAERGELKPAGGIGAQRLANAAA
jgi:hypothetical protein